MKNPINQPIDPFLVAAIEKRVNEEALVEWAAKKEPHRIIPPLPYEKKHKPLISILTSNLP